MAEQHHSLAGPASSQAPASQLCVQSSDNIHIQMEPLHSMDRYAAKLMCPTMELAIYSGRCPLTMLATHHPPRPLQQQVSLCPLFACLLCAPATSSSFTRWRVCHRLCTLLPSYFCLQHVVKEALCISGIMDAVACQTRDMCAEAAQHTAQIFTAQPKAATWIIILGLRATL